jgi:hypothetical protein
LSDDTGLLEHARNSIARREHGYCVDDVSRGLLVACREPQPTALVAGLAEPLSVAVISDLLGVPEADRPLLRPWSAQICGMYEVNPSEEAGRVASRAANEFSDYLRGLIRERRARPADDLVTALTQVVDGGDQLTEDELIGTVVLLLNAGHEATVNFTGIGWWQLFRHPDQLDRLRRDPGLLPRAIDELLRYDTPLQMFERWVLEDVEIGGVAVPKGAELGLLFGSANRDPAVFADPDRLDLTRADAAQHLSFGAGVHYCLGAPLGRLELELSFGTLLRRLPAMAPAAEVTWTELESPLFPGRWVTRITVDPDTAKVAWATFSGWRSGESYPHILMTSDGGSTWVDIAGKKIPQAPINDVIRHPAKPKWLFVATDVGVYRTTNLGQTWLKVGANLPLVPVNDIDLPAGSNTLYAATYGRSVWTTSLADVAS